MNRQSRFDAGYRKLGAGALGWPRGMVWGGRWDGGSGWGTCVHLWRMHVDVWQNQYNIVKLKKKKISSIQSLSHVWLSATQWTAARQVSLSITNSGIYSNSCPLSQWCHLTISSSVARFSSCLKSFPASGSFQMGQFFIFFYLNLFILIRG